MPAVASSLVLRVGVVLFPDVAQLDVTHLYEVLARMPSTQVHVVAATLAPVRSEQGLAIAPDVTFETAPSLDVICVPGGGGVSLAMEGEALPRFLQQQARHARYVTSVSAGALVLGAAGLLRGYRATTHWSSLALLPRFGAHPVEARVVIDRDRITGWGVTAGSEVGLLIASALRGPTVARGIQLLIGYNPVAPDRRDTTSVAAPDPLGRPVEPRQATQSGSRTGQGVAIDELAPGTTIVARTRNSQYRFVILFEPHVVLVTGGAMFPDAKVVRLDGAPGGGGSRRGWILVGRRMQMWLGPVRIRTSAVRSVTIESVPAVCAYDGRPRA